MADPNPPNPRLPRPGRGPAQAAAKGGRPGGAAGAARAGGRGRPAPAPRGAAAEAGGGWLLYAAAGGLGKCTHQNDLQGVRQPALAASPAPAHAHRPPHCAPPSLQALHEAARTAKKEVKAAQVGGSTGWRAAGRRHLTWADRNACRPASRALASTSLRHHKPHHSPLPYIWQDLITHDDLRSHPFALKALSSPTHPPPLPLSPPLFAGPHLPR